MFNFCMKVDHRLTEAFEDQIRVCSRFLINNMEIGDRIDGIHLTEVNGRVIEQYRRLLISQNKKIVLLDSSISLEDTEKYLMLLRNAHLLGVENIRIIPELPGGSLKEGKGSLILRLRGTLRTGESYGIGVVFENNHRSQFAGEEAITDILRQFDEFRPGLVFNPLEFATIKKHPFFHVFYNSRWKPCIKFLRVNDGLFRDGSPVMPGEGNAEIKEMASALLARSFNGYFSFHPYFEKMDEGTYGMVIDRFKKLLLEM